MKDWAALLLGQLMKESPGFPAFLLCTPECTGMTGPGGGIGKISTV